VFWTPLIIRGLLTGEVLTSKAAAGDNRSIKGSLPAVGLSTIPFAVGVFCVWAAAWHAQKTKELVLHAAIPLMIGGVVMACFPLLANASPIAGFVGLIVAVALPLSANATISAIMAAINRGPQEVVALPCFDVIMNLGAIIGAPVVGLIIQKTTTGFKWATVSIGCLVVVAAFMLLALAVWVAHGPLAAQLFLRRRQRFKVVAFDEDGHENNGVQMGAPAAVIKAVSAGDGRV